MIKHLHQIADDTSDAVMSPFDTVRGMFTEGHPLYDGSGFHEQSHVQIAVRNPALIKGVFLPPELEQQI